jgi:hypothetical protein
MVTFATAALAGIAPGSGISLSKHDINTLKGASQDSQQRICAFCHTPHHAYDPNAYDYMPLWSHDLTQQTFTPYQSVTLEPDTREVVDPLAGPSRLCMSCHDGIIAADRHYSTFEPGTRILTGDGADSKAVGFGGDMTNDHPIGFDYTKVAGANGASGTDRRIFAADATRTFRGNPSVLIRDQLHSGTIMTCATCHDVHNKDNTNGGGTYNYFVHAPQQDSQLCLSCHDK